VIAGAEAAEDFRCRECGNLFEVEYPGLLPGGLSAGDQKSSTWTPLKPTEGLNGPPSNNAARMEHPANLPGAQMLGTWGTQPPSNNAARMEHPDDLPGAQMLGTWGTQVSVSHPTSQKRDPSTGSGQALGHSADAHRDNSQNNEPNDHPTLRMR
jgi:hypothetical protein